MKYEFKTRPHPHQVQGIRFAFERFRQGSGVGFLFEPRTGKTKTTIDSLAILHEKYGVRKALIICPNRVMGTWVREFAKHSTLHVQCIVWDREERRKDLPLSVEPYDMQVLITNFETFSTPGKRLRSGNRSRASGRFKHRSKILKWIGREKVAAVVDEAHKLKSASGKASTMIVSMADRFTYRFALTGTPITKANRAHDCFMLWQWINPNRFSSWGYSYEAFKNHVGEWYSPNGESFKLWKRAKPRGMADLQRGIHADALVVERKQIQHLPPEHRVISVPLSTKTGAHYDRMAEEMYTELENGEISEAQIPLVVTLRLSQITSGYVSVQKPHPTKPDTMIAIPRRVGTEKLSALKELLVEETIERDEKVVIAARFKPDLNAIEKLCRALKLPVWSIRGGMPRSETDGALRAFEKYTRGAAVMVVQPQSAALGIDLSTANHMVWYSLTSSWVDFTQTNDRIALNPENILYSYILATDTVDEVLYNTLLTDGQVAKEILKRPERIKRK